MLTAWQQIALLVTTLGAMFLTAKLFSKSEAKVERKEPASSGPPPQIKLPNAPSSAELATAPVSAASRNDSRMAALRSELKAHS
jgi:hypothetical protein